jgi:hypothetical protein
MALSPLKPGSPLAVAVENILPQDQGITWTVKSDFDFKAGSPVICIRGVKGQRGVEMSAHAPTDQLVVVAASICKVIVDEINRLERPLAKPKRGLSILLNVGPWGGVYLQRGTQSWRLCLGWIAISIYAADIDPILADWAERIAERKRQHTTG